MSLIARSSYNPAFPSVNPFTSVLADFYWSSTTYAYGTGNAWDVDMWDGSVYSYNKTNNYYVWPVRGGN